MTRAASLFLLLWLPAALVSAEEETVPSPSPSPAAEDGATEATAAETPTDDATSSGALDETLITVWGDRPRRFDVIQGTNVLEGDRFERDLSITIGETLERQVGVHNSGFGPGAGRPVIRGFDGNRIRVLQNGIGTLDASAASPDHNVAVEPLGVERIEVVRGAGTLRFGPSAIGGVVNVIDGRIPTAVPDDQFDLALRSGYGSNNDDRFFSGATTMGWGPLAVYGQGFIRSTDDLKINGLNVSSRRRDQLTAAGEDVEAFRHVVDGTDIDENRGGTAGISWIGSEGYAGFAFTRIRNNYGILEAFEEEDPGMGMMMEEEGGVRIDLEANRYDVAAEWNRDLLAFDQFSFRGAYSDYNHDEIEGGEVGSTWERYAWEGRFEARQRPIAMPSLGGNDLAGLWGVQFEVGNFRALGDEAFLPRTDTLKTGLFSIQQLPVGPVDLEAGLRWDFTQHDLRGLTPELALLGVDTGDETFNTVSFSTGVSYSPMEGYLVGLSLSRTERAPSVEELFSGGPHLATAGFEIGDPDLDKEAGIGLEVSARRRIGRLTGSANLYYTTFDDYIFQRITGAEIDGLPVRQYVQEDAEIWGAEVELDLLAYERDDFRGLFDLGFDFVRGSTDDDGDLPRIAPWRVRIGAEAQSRYADLRLEVLYVGEQDQPARMELKTDDYAVFNASLAIRPLGDRYDLSLLLEGRNLTNSEARNHVSFLKDVLPLPGRDLRVSLRYAF